MRYCIFFILLSAGFCSCTPTNTKTKERPDVFFDLVEFFDQEAMQWSNQTVEKTVTLGETSETLNKSDLDYKAEFQVFKQADINRISWSDKYTVDSLFENGQLSRVDYQAKSDAEKTRKLAVYYQSGAVQKIEIDRIVKNILFNTNQSLIFETAKGYSIITEQSVRFFKPKKNTIQVNLK